MKQFSQLPSFFEALQAADPGGIYYLESDKLSNNPSYNIPQAPEDADYFVSYIVIPSVAIKFFAQSSKILTVDGAHVYAKMDGVILTVNVKDASNSIIPLGISYVNIENSKNWSVFYECIVGVFRDILLIVSDKDKGLNALRLITIAMAKIKKLKYDMAVLQATILTATSTNTSITQSATKQQIQAQPPPPQLLPTLVSSVSEFFALAWAICVIHILKNSCSRQEYFKLATNLAKAPTEAAYAYYLQKIRTEVSDTAANAINSRKEEFSFMSLQKRGLKTNLGEVTSNSAESNNWALSEFRSLGPIDSIVTYLTKVLPSRFIHGATSSAKLVATKCLVHPVHVESLSKLVARFPDAKVNIQAINYGTNTITVLVTFKGNINTVVLCADPNNNMEWFERIDCKCGYTRVLGKPCLHGIHALLTICKEILSRRLDLLDIRQWHHAMPKWYHVAFHMSTYVSQYQGMEVIFPTIDLSSLQPHAFYPPLIVKPKGRPKLHRFKKQKITSSSSNVTEAVSPNDENEDDEDEDDDDDDDDNDGIEFEGDAPSTSFASDLTFLPDYLQPSAVESKKKSVKHCGCCGLAGHQAQHCNTKSTVYIVGKYAEGKKIKDYPVVPVETLNKLKFKSWDGLDIDYLDASDDEGDDNEDSDSNRNQVGLSITIPGSRMIAGTSSTSSSNA